MPRKAHCSVNAANDSAIHSGTVAMHPSVLLEVRVNSQWSAPPRSSSRLTAADVEETTHPTTGAV